MKLLLLIGQRRSEVGNLRSEWLDLDKSTWTTPSDYSKNKRSHTFPLGATSAAILKAIKTDGGIVFPARGAGNKTFSGFSKAKAQLNEKIIKLRKKDDKLYKLVPWTLHDLRRTLATNWQRLGIATEFIETYSNHVSGTRAGIVGVYQKHKFWDEMVEAVRKYENWLATVIQGRSASKAT